MKSVALRRGGALTRPGGRSVAVQHFGLVLVPRGRRPVRVDDQGPAPAVDDDLVVERAQQHAVLDGGLAAVGLVLRVVHLAGAGGLGAAAGPLAVPVPQQDRVADPRRDRLGVADVQRQARPAEADAELPAAQERLASPPGPDSRSTALPITACSTAAQAAVVLRSRRVRAPPRRSLSSSTQSRTRSSRASTLTSPVTMGAIAASQAMAAAASPSSHAPSDAPVSAACARRAAHRARTRSVHCSCRAESPSSRSRSAREMCAQALTGCPARSGSSPVAVSRRIASASASWYRCSWVRSSSFPAGAASASSTAATAAAHSAVRSPCTTPAPPIVAASLTSRSAKSARGPGRAGPRGPARTSRRTGPPGAQPSPRRRRPAALITRRSGTSRASAGQHADHRPTDSDT